MLSLPSQFSTTHDVDLASNAPNFLGSGAIPANFQENTALTPAEAPALTANYIPDQKLPYSISWNFGVQHNFRQNYVFEARYLGTRGVHLITQSHLNSIAVVTPSRSLPTYLQNPGPAALDALPLALDALRAIPHNSLAGLGFENPITAFHSRGNSIYTAWRCLELRAALHLESPHRRKYAEFFSSYLSPRRPQDFFDMRNERGTSALDRRHRFTLGAVYDTPWFKHSESWFMRNIAGNFLFSGHYTVESPEYATLQIGVDSNLNGDSAGDRTALNPKGVPNTGAL